MLTAELDIAAAIKVVEQQLMPDSNALLDAKLLVKAVSGLSNTELITKADSTLNKEQLTQLSSLLTDRKSGKPLAYILGHQPFWTLDLQVSSATLIPRPETEVLVEQALLKLNEIITGNTLHILSKKSASTSVLDLGTGTGAVALALASEIPDLSVIGVDFSDEIVRLAQINAKNNQIACDFIVSNWFSNVPIQRYSVIVSNPPYIESNSQYINNGSLQFEPESALTAGADGLDDIRHIVALSPTYLSDGGWLLLEHGFNQASETRALLYEQGFQNIASVNDLNAIPRVTMGQYFYNKNT